MDWKTSVSFLAHLDDSHYGSKKHCVEYNDPIIHFEKVHQPFIGSYQRYKQIHCITYVCSQVEQELRFFHWIWYKKYFVQRFPSFLAHMDDLNHYRKSVKPKPQSRITQSREVHSILVTNPESVDMSKNHDFFGIFWNPILNFFFDFRLFFFA